MTAFDMLSHSIKTYIMLITRIIIGIIVVIIKVEYTRFLSLG